MPDYEGDPGYEEEVIPPEEPYVEDPYYMGDPAWWEYYVEEWECHVDDDFDFTDFDYEDWDSFLDAYLL